jgi:hypothetical protein
MMEKSKKKLKGWAWALIALGSVILTVCASFFIYVGIYYHSDDVSSFLKDDSGASVKDEGNISFIPASPKAGFVFYPGGKVEEKAYAPLCHSLAEKGVYVVLVKMPFRLAVFGVNKAAGIPENHPEVSSWYLAGHSLGGAMAASFLGKGNQGYSGLALFGAYSTSDLSASGLKTITLYGENDRVMNRSKYQSNYAHLAPDNTEKIIAGGNHSGFAYYGPQKGDGEATISKEKQIALSVDYLTTWMGIS